MYISKKNMFLDTFINSKKQTPITTIGQSTVSNSRSNFSKTCTVNLYDIDPKTVNEYMKYNGLIGKSGDCEDSTINMNISTCPTNENVSPSPDCSPTINIVKTINLNNITNTQNPIFPKILNPLNIQNYFGYS